MARRHVSFLAGDREFNRFLDDFQRESDRAAAVLGAAYLDDLLKELLLAAWVGGSSRVRNLVGRNGPLGAFGARIAVAYATGLITSDERQGLDIVREIRNDFAHKASRLSFRTREIIHRCRSFAVTRERFEAEPKLKKAYTRASARRLFNLATSLLAYYLTRRLRNAERTRHPNPPLWPEYDLPGEVRKKR